MSERQLASGKAVQASRQAIAVRRKGSRTDPGWVEHTLKACATLTRTSRNRPWRLMRHLLDRQRPQVLHEFLRSNQIKLSVGGLNHQEKLVARDGGKTVNVEHRMMRHRQPVQ